jgi:hypothetical protein
MKNLKAQYLIVAIWLSGLSFCLATALVKHDYIPKLLDNLLTQIFETFSPPLAIMLAFLFSDKIFSRKNKVAPMPISALAVFLSVAYVICFSWVMFDFHRQALRADQAINLINTIRPKTSFLITGMVTFYFASRK